MKNQWLGKAICGLVGLAGSLVFLYLISCDGPKCCPHITAFDAEKWVCPADCPGGGTAKITYTVEFWKDKERCRPPKDFKILIKNLAGTEPDRELRWTDPGTGVITGSYDLPVTENSSYSLVALTGEQECGEAKKEFPVNVVNDRAYEDLCFTGILDYPQITKLPDQDTTLFGPGVLIDHIEIVKMNLNTQFKVNVQHGINYMGLYPPWNDAHGNHPGNPGYPASAQGPQNPNGKWIVEVPYPEECEMFDQLPQDQRQICVRVYLKCDCP